MRHARNQITGIAALFQDLRDAAGHKISRIDSVSNESVLPKKGGCYHGMVDMGAYRRWRCGNWCAETDDVQEDEREEKQKTNI